MLFLKKEIILTSPCREGGISCERGLNLRGDVRTSKKKKKSRKQLIIITKGRVFPTKPIGGGA